MKRFASDNDKITAQYLYPRLEQFFKPNDIIIAETGTSSMGLGFALLPEGAQFHNQTLWGSIGLGNTGCIRRCISGTRKTYYFNYRRRLSSVNNTRN